MTAGSERWKYLTVDFIMAALAILLFDIARFHVLGLENVGYYSLKAFLLSPVILTEQTVLPFMLLAVEALSGYYNRPLLRSRIQEFVTTLLTALVQTPLVYFALLANQQTSVRATNFLMLGLLMLLLFSLTYLGRLILTSWQRRRFLSGSAKFNIIVIGTGPEARKLSENISANTHLTGISVAHVEEIAQGHTPDLQALASICRTRDVKEIYLTSRDLSEEWTLNTLSALFPLGLPVKVSPDTLPILGSTIRLQSIYEEPYIDISSPGITDATKNIKRFLDVLVSSLVLLILSVPLCIVALAVRLSSKGPAFFTQERIGLRQKPFQIVKFRSMYTDAEEQGPALSKEGDPRITPLGRWLRKYRIDELPQFWNVLRGDMSLVGPRPERRFFIEKIMQRAPYYSLVHQVRPGITSWGMVKYGYAASVDQMVARLRYDLIYLTNISLTNDLKIIIYTIKTVLKGRGM